MNTIIIGGRERKIQPKFGAIRRLTEKHEDVINQLMIKGRDSKVDSEFMENFSLELVWEFLQKNCLGRKPFGTLENLKENIDPYELKMASKKCFYLFNGLDPAKYGEFMEEPEDRDQGNDVPENGLEK